MSKIKSICLVLLILCSGCFLAKSRVDPYSPEGKKYEVSSFGVRCLYCRRVIAVSRQVLDNGTVLRCPACGNDNPISVLRESPIYGR
ncbi:MAG: hypothetical protein PHV17_04785 [Candidatus Omnitrophica bacterium]|nr:hypothetical protein [Candidatus Omnitrophota bacterium]